MKVYFEGQDVIKSQLFVNSMMKYIGVNGKIAIREGQFVNILFPDGHSWWIEESLIKYYTENIVEF